MSMRWNKRGLKEEVKQLVLHQIMSSHFWIQLCTNLLKKLLCKIENKKGIRWNNLDQGHIKLILSILMRQRNIKIIILVRILKDLKKNNQKLVFPFMMSIIPKKAKKVILLFFLKLKDGKLLKVLRNNLVLDFTNLQKIILERYSK